MSCDCNPRWLQQSLITYFSSFSLSLEPCTLTPFTPSHMPRTLHYHTSFYRCFLSTFGTRCFCFTSPSFSGSLWSPRCPFIYSFRIPFVSTLPFSCRYESLCLFLYVKLSEADPQSAYRMDWMHLTKFNLYPPLLAAMASTNSE